MIDYTNTFDRLKETSRNDNKKTYVDILEELKTDPITTAHNYPKQVEAALDYVIDKLKLRDEFVTKPRTFEELNKLSVEFHKDSWMGDPPVDPQWALDFLWDNLDKKIMSCLTTVPESTEQVNYLVLKNLLYYYSSDFRKFCKQKKKERSK